MTDIISITTQTDGIQITVTDNTQKVSASASVGETVQIKSVGFQGEKGDQGIQGEQGPIGLTGPQGIQGIKGDTGSIGPEGPRGFQGIQGIEGPQGDQGIKGDTGNTGPQGLRGLTGDQGEQGIQGLKGDTGSQGPQGLQGVKGDDGGQGPQGIQGIQGLQGVQGEIGPQGTAGVGVISGGTTGQVLAKKSNTNYDTEWVENEMPVGNDKEIQFNDNGAVGADPDLKFDKAYGSLILGQSGVPLTNNPLAVAGSVDDFLQTNIQNQSTLSSASSDYVATADNGNDSVNYVDLGINGSTYDVVDDITGANDSYLWNNGGDMHHIAESLGAEIHFVVGGSESTDLQATIDASGINLPAGKTFRIDGAAVGGVTEFTELNDAPASYTGQTLKTVRVKADETGLEFYTPTIGAGDVTSNTATSVNDELVLFNSTSGKQIKRATNTGLIKCTSGVVSTASAGTDYIVPSGSGASLTGITASQVGALATSAFSGVAKISVGTSTPTGPAAGDLWVDTN